MISLNFPYVSHVSGDPLDPRSFRVRSGITPGRAKSSKVQAWSLVKTPSKMSEPGPWVMNGDEWL